MSKPHLQECPHCSIIDLVDAYVDRQCEPEEMVHMLSVALGEVIGNFEGEDRRRQLLLEATHIVYLEMCGKTTFNSLIEFAEYAQQSNARLN